MKISSIATNTSQISNIRQQGSIAGKLTSELLADNKKLEDQPKPENTISKALVSTTSGPSREVLLLTEKFSERIEALFSRIPEDHRQGLINTKMVIDETFLQLAESMDDAELQQLTGTIQKLQVMPEAKGAYFHDGTREAQMLVDDLSEMSASTRQRVLDQAEIYADQISPPVEDETYTQDGIYQRQQAYASADNLYNFISAVNKTGDADEMLDSLEGYDDTQQEKLLMFLGTNAELGEQITAGLDNKTTRATDAVLDYLGGMVSQVRQNYQHGNFSEPFMSRFDEHYRTLGQDDERPKAIKDMIDTSLDLFFEHKFSDDQLEDMASKLSTMDAANQRSYLAITTTGLETLLGDDAKELELQNETKVIETLDQLRDDARIREAVSYSRLGNEAEDQSPGLHHRKDDGLSEQDQNNLVELLVTDAWLNPDDTDRTAQLAESFSQVSADQRDTLVREVNKLDLDETPLAQQTQKDQQERYAALLDRTNTIIETDNLETLLAVEQQFDSNQRQEFWKVADQAGDLVDPLMEVFSNNTDRVNDQLLRNLSALTSNVDLGKTSGLQARNQLIDTINFFSEEQSKEDVQTFLSQGLRNTLLNS